MKTLTILGATGSIGTSALKVVDMHPDKFRVKCLTCATNIDLLAAQIKQFRPAMVAVLDEERAGRLAKSFPAASVPKSYGANPVL